MAYGKSLEKAEPSSSRSMIVSRTPVEDDVTKSKVRTKLLDADRYILQKDGSIRRNPDWAKGSRR